MKSSLSGRYCNPSSEDQAEIVLRLYFGDGDDKLRLAIRRAHQDFSRTVHGIGKYPNARSKGDDFMYGAIAKLVMQQKDASQALFDVWHEKTSKDLCAIYCAAGYKAFYIGQAQKWINMALSTSTYLGSHAYLDTASFFRTAMCQSITSFSRRMSSKNFARLSVRGAAFRIMVNT